MRIVPLSGCMMRAYTIVQALTSWLYVDRGDNIALKVHSPSSSVRNVKLLTTSKYLVKSHLPKMKADAL